ncbi:MAG: hypothetical protein HGA44_13900, partial [Cellulomonadaceae bacterium]|nr:hypothetical protein [Cellulomonadaceae bacterium]
MRCARATSLLVAAALTMSVGACTSDRGDPEASSADGPGPVLVPLDSTAWIDAVDRAESYDVIAGGPTDARVVAAVVSHGEGPAGVRVWTADEGEVAGSPVDVPGVIGDVTSVAADGTADLAALAGSVWSDGRTSSYLVTSRDRVAWDAVELPPDVAQTRVTDVAVVDETTVVLTGAGVAGRQPTVSVLDTVTGEASTWALPTSPDTDTTLTGVAAVGAQVLVTAAVGKRGEPASQVSFVSLDRGSTFDGPFPLAAAGATVSGVVRARSAWLATGGQRGTDGVQVPTAWSSTDGRTWQQDGERVVTQEDGTTYAEGEDAAFGAPVVRAGQVGV